METKDRINHTINISTCYGKYSPTSDNCPDCEYRTYCIEAKDINVSYTREVFDIPEPEVSIQEAERIRIIRLVIGLTDMIRSITHDASLQDEQKQKIRNFELIIRKMQHPELSLAILAEQFGWKSKQALAYFINTCIKNIPDLKYLIVMDGRYNKHKKGNNYGTRRQAETQNPREDSEVKRNNRQP